MKVCLGILARNEGGRIANLISDLGGQTLMKNDALSIQIHVVANGCTDDTTDVAAKALADGPFPKSNVEWKVHSLEQPGKSNAWNEFIHRIAPDDTDFAFLLDADIRIPESETLQLVLDALLNAPQAVVAVDESVKDLTLERPRTISEWLIRAGTGTADDTRTAIAGAFYCARFEELKKIWMPIGLPGEDGFLRAMLLTSSFSHPEKLERHVFVEGGRHIFEALRDLKGVYRHNVRLAVGTGVNIVLFEHLRKLRSEGVDLADYIRTRNLSNPNWINEPVQNRTRNRLRFPLEAKFLLRRFRPFSDLPLIERFRRIPVLIVGLALDFLVYFKANALMRRGQGAGYW